MGFTQGNLTLNHDKRIVGCWQKINIQSAQTPHIFINDFLEFYDNGVCISRNEHSNMINNVDFFYWFVRDDILNIYEKGGVGTLCSFSLNGNILTIQATGDYAKAFQATLKKVYDNPLENYKKYLPADGVEGKWAVPVVYVNGDGRMDDNHGCYYDIHPTNNNNSIGEIISYCSNDIYDSLYFFKYTFHYNVNRDLNTIPFFKFLNKLDPNSSKDTNNYIYSCNWLNYNAHEDVDCYTSDGIIIIYEPNQISYLVKAGPPNWTDVTALHEKYNAY